MKELKKHLIKMPSIGQFSPLFKNIKQKAQYVETLEDGTIVVDRDAILPKLTFTILEKIHGTNAGIAYNGKELWAQSKGNIITPEKDNAGFAFFVESHKGYLTNELKNIRDTFGMDELVLYGEYAGQGIQKNVAVSELPKTFYMFGIKYKMPGEEHYKWVQKPEVVLGHISDGEKIRSLYEFWSSEIEIDFNDPVQAKQAQNKIIDITLEIERESPVGKAHGVSGIGEGIVCTCFYEDEQLIFKSKGEKHAGKSRVKVLKPVDTVKEQKRIDFAEYATPVWRLEQAVQETFDTLNGGEPEIKGTGDVIRWVLGDILKEETQEMNKLNLEPKEINKYVSKIVQKWFHAKLEEI